MKVKWTKALILLGLLTAVSCGKAKFNGDGASRGRSAPNPTSTPVVDPCLLTNTCPPVPECNPEDPSCIPGLTPGNPNNPNVPPQCGPNGEGCSPPFPPCVDGKDCDNPGNNPPPPGGGFPPPPGGGFPPPPGGGFPPPPGGGYPPPPPGSCIPGKWPCYPCDPYKGECDQPWQNDPSQHR